jgi:hypothetical protein
MRRRFGAVLCCALAGSALADGTVKVETMVRWEATGANTSAGPTAVARSLSPQVAAPANDGLRLSAELSGSARLGRDVSLVGNVLLAHERPEGAPGRDTSRINEAHAAIGHGEWQLVAGKRVLGWDVGYAFRPNDVVQREQRRTLVAQTAEGRPVVQLERLLPDAAWSVVWAQPQHWRDAADQTRGALESAVALQVYQRDGSLDLHGFGRMGRRTGASVGLAAAWVPGDALELHASWRAMQHHDRWAMSDSVLLAGGNPWQQQMRGGAAQWLLGGQWTVAQQWNLLMEAWHDGTALADDEWDAWRARNLALAQAAAGGAPALPAAANLAWQATPLQNTSLRRRNVFVRGAWQDGPLTVSLDVLMTPQDRGRIVTASMQWKGDRTMLTVAWRRYGGPEPALTAQLPSRSAGVLALSLPF